ncbi:hypothetical protein SEA_MUFASA_37 [Mycobacterium phage Mufasa]|uniref:Uncharacterized protein n=1 Tax=Mycobacterium phage Mufasa TaxID=1718600 RepID=A0A0M3UKB0_9CAUD|nr:hypothetical protein SEA_MUFASA_37 [Mycobacterium phage Mufasa]ALF00471.1 hypothetical protein SEA_MUFASA_37 [Mycobacterium phage Mufasa]
MSDNADYSRVFSIDFAKHVVECEGRPFALVKSPVEVTDDDPAPLLAERVTVRDSRGEAPDRRGWVTALGIYTPTLWVALID